MSGERYLVAGRYRLGQRIGSGAMGIVWQALDERLNRTVAVKQLLLSAGLDPDEAEEAKQRSMREGRIAARLHHPNAVAVYDVVDDDGSPCLVMEYLPSRSLDDVLTEHGALPPAEVARIGAGVAAALAAAHAAGIVHRDIKPANVLLGQNGIVKITDFGISRATDDVTVTKTGLIAGTPAYLAPEVAVGREPRSPSDVFSLGSTLYAAVEGEPPFGLSENTLGLLHAVAAGRVNPPKQAGPLTDVLMSLLRPRPEDRPDAPRAAGMLGAVARGERPDVPDTVALGAAPGMPPSEVPTRALGAAPGPSRTATALQPSDASAAYERPERTKSRRGLLIGALAAVLLTAIVIILVTNGLLGGEAQRRDQGTVTTSSEQRPTSQSTVPNEAPATRSTEEATKETTAESPPPVQPTTETITTTETTTTTTTDTTTTATTTTEANGQGGGNQGNGGNGNQGVTQGR